MTNRLALLLIALLAWITPLHAQGDLHAEATLFARTEGNDVKAVVEIKIDSGWHLYHEDLGKGGGVGTPTTLIWGGLPINWSPTKFPAPKKSRQPGMKAPEGGVAWAWAHEGRIVLYARGHSDSGTPDLTKITLAIDGLTCEEDGVCVPYGEELEVEGPGDDALFANFPADLKPGEAAPTDSGPVARVDASAEANSPKWDAFVAPEFEPRGDVDRSLWLWLVFAFIAGAVLNVMPCVLPVVSIKVLSFVQQAGESKQRVFQLGLAFAGGILAVFAVLAALAAFAGLGWGEQFQKEWFKIAMVAIVFAFSLSLFDVFELGVPSKVGELASVKREGLRDAFFKGIMATILATPCSGPFLGSTLAWAVTQPALVVMAVFMMVGVGMAAPYVVLTSNPGLLRFLPKPGAWMQTFKHSTGFLLLGTVLFLLIGINQNLLIYTMAMLVFVALGCWWWGRFASFEQTTSQHLRTLAIALLLAGGGAYVVFGPVKDSLTPEEGALVWEDFDPEAYARYRAEKRPVMLDFTAVW